MELSQDEIKRQDLDAAALRVFLKAMEIAGGLRELVQRRNLTWVPSLLQASYAIVLREEYGKTEEEIASLLGTSRGTIRHILRADPDLVRRRLEESLDSEETRTHIAGGLAKQAFMSLKSGEPIGLLANLLKSEGCQSTHDSRQ